METRNEVAEPAELDQGIIGVATDIHGNPYALAEVLRDGAEQGVSRWLVLGDVVAMGPEPATVLDQLLQVDVVAWIRGNTERYILTGDRPGPTLEEVAADPGLLSRLTDVVGTFAWTKGHLHALDRLSLLQSFRASAHFRLPDGTVMLAVHASLVADDGRGISPDVEAEEMSQQFPGTEASLVFGGHTHKATDVTYGATRFVNPGSVSNQHAATDVANYCLLHLEDDHHRVEHRTVPYDKELAIESIRRCGIPGAEFLLRQYFGVRTP